MAWLAWTYLAVSVGFESLEVLVCGLAVDGIFEDERCVDVDLLANKVEVGRSGNAIGVVDVRLARVPEEIRLLGVRIATKV